MRKDENNLFTHEARKDSQLKDDGWRIQKGGSEQVGSFSARSKWLCVNLQWPILEWVRMISVFLGFKVSQTARHGLISFNFFFSERPPHSLCYFFFMKELTASFTLHLKKILPLLPRISIVALEKIVPCHPSKFLLSLQESSKEFNANSRSFV